MVVVALLLLDSDHQVSAIKVIYRGGDAGVNSATVALPHVSFDMASGDGGQQRITATSAGGSFIAQDCNATQISQLANALNEAIAFLPNTLAYLDQGCHEDQYAEWFGNYSNSISTQATAAASARFELVRRRYHTLYEWLVSSTFHFVCLNAAACDSGDPDFFIIAANPFQRDLFNKYILFCPAFFDASLIRKTIGQDSQSGTIVHETTHFNAVELQLPGTLDYAYGATLCHQLAVTSPELAANNADNYEFFYEFQPYHPACCHLGGLVNSTSAGCAQCIAAPGCHWCNDVQGLQSHCLQTNSTQMHCQSFGKLNPEGWTTTTRQCERGPIGLGTCKLDTLCGFYRKRVACNLTH